MKETTTTPLIYGKKDKNDLRLTGWIDPRLKMMNTETVAQENLDAVEQLKQLVVQHTATPGDVNTPVAGLVLHRRDHPNKPENCFTCPIVALTLQGQKRTMVGSEEYRYGAGYSLLAGIDLPTMSYTTHATPEEPYLVISLELDLQLISQLTIQMPKDIPSDEMHQGAAVIKTPPEQIHAFTRLLKLLDTPEQIPVLGPVILKEIHLQLLLGEQGGLLRALNTQGTRSNQVMNSINWLRENYRAPLDVDELASHAFLATSTYRKHFKEITTMSPTEYHKHLRLYEAQRLMLEEDQDATTAGYAVGYESLSQFSREYKRLFGEPPQRSVSQLR